MELVRQATKADVIAAALRALQGRLGAFVSARVPSEEVDDILQTAAARAIQMAETLTDPARVVPWLFRVHRNVITDEIRRRESRRRLLESAALDDNQNATEPDAMCRCSVSQASRLEPNYATILALVDMGDSTLMEAAQTLGISRNSATVRLHRARKALRKRMLDHCGVSSLRDCIDCRCVYDGCCAT